MGDAVSPEAAFDAVANELLPEPGVDEGTGFGSNPGLRVDGHIFAMLVRGALVVKLPAERCADLVEEGEAEAFQIGKRRMTEWISVGRPDAARWVELAGEARAFVAG
jgi:hypothetical protein